MYSGRSAQDGTCGGLKMCTVGERIQQLNDPSTLRKKTRTQTQASSDKRTTGRRCSSRLRPNGLDIAVARFQVYWNMVRILYSLIPVRPWQTGFPPHHQFMYDGLSVMRFEKCRYLRLQPLYPNEQVERITQEAPNLWFSPPPRTAATIDISMQPLPAKQAPGGSKMTVTECVGVACARSLGMTWECEYLKATKTHQQQNSGRVRFLQLQLWPFTKGELCGEFNMHVQYTVADIACTDGFAIQLAMCICCMQVH